jgi:alpha-1,3-glucosyltransferase
MGLRRSFSGDVYLCIFVIITCIKVLLFPCYRSTDFEVHRNWLAITHTLPLREWYFANRSEWSLDYPPLFAYFENLLSYVAVVFDSRMVDIDNLDYASKATIYFQRSSVIACDAVLPIAVWRYAHSSCASCEAAMVLFTLSICNAGLLLVDHIHFQYNGMLLGLLVFCFDLANRKQHLQLAFVFSVLVLMKHLFVCMVPVFGVYLIAAHCRRGDKQRSFSIFKFGSLVTVALSILLVAFGPFIAQVNGYDQIKQMFTQMFPFGRGLVHAYWAPNVWALYYFADKMLGIIAHNYLGSAIHQQLGNDSCSGLVGDFKLNVLPRISPFVSMILVLGSQAPALFTLYKTPTAQNLIRCTVYCTMCSFMFGYHVHEKAILVPLTALSLISVEGSLERNVFMHMAAVGIYGLFPLFVGLQELPVKGMLSMTRVICPVLDTFDRTRL